MNHSDAPLDTLRIMIQPSTELGGHEVRLLSGGEDLLQRFSNMMLGLDPNDILVDPCPLLPSTPPRAVIIGQCDCGMIACGNVKVTIASDGGVVTWTTPDRPVGARFDAAQYKAEISRALGDFSWEPPDRTASRLISRMVDHAHLERRGLQFQRAFSSSGQQTLVLSLRYEPGPHQVLVHVPWGGEDPAVIAERCVRLLLEEPRTWERVEWTPVVHELRAEWTPVVHELGAPSIAGPGWKPGVA